MTTALPFSDLLTSYLEKTGLTPGRLSRLSGVPKKTIQNWIGGIVKRPYSPNDLLKVAETLHLTIQQTDSLLSAAGHHPLSELSRLATDPHTHQLLAPWRNALSRSTPPPFQAIADIPTFVGREQEIQELSRTLLKKEPVGVCCIQGMGGVGKTTIAAHLAYRLRPHFPDGILWARVDVTPPLAILSAFAHAFGYDVSGTHDLHARSQIVRSLLSDKHALIIFDNVEHSAEIELLLPPSGSSRVLITTRRHDLMISAAGTRYTLAPFTEDSGGSQALFTSILGSERATAERATLADIANQLGHLPLALAICASRLAYEPGWNIADFAARLRTEQRRLKELEYDTRSVRTTFNLSYANLNPTQQHCLMALGICAGADVGTAALASMLALPVEETLIVVRKLYGLSLVQHGQTDRFRLHPLVKSYILEQPTDTALWHGMATYFIDHLKHHSHNYIALDREFDNILGALDAAYTHAMHTQLLDGVLACVPYLRDRGHYELSVKYLQHAATRTQTTNNIDDQLTIIFEQGQLAEQYGHPLQAKEYWQAGLTLARQHNKPAGIATMLIPLGEIAGHAGNRAEMETYWQEALAATYALDDHLRASELLRHLGFRTIKIGDFPRTVVYWRDALTLARKANAPEQMCRLLSSLSAILREQGNWAESTAYAQEGIHIAQQHRYDQLAALMLGTLGIIARQQHDLMSAESYLKEALHIARNINHHTTVGDILTNLASIARLRANHDQAIIYLEEAQEIAHRMRLAWLICETHCQWGELELVRQSWEAAALSFTQAKNIAHKRHQPIYFAHASYGLARAAAGQQRYDEARQQGEESLHCYQTMGHYRASEIAAWLESLLTARLYGSGEPH